MRFDSHGIDESLEGILRPVGIHPGLEGLRPVGIHEGLEGLRPVGIHEGLEGLRQVGIHEGFCRWELEDETIVIKESSNFD
jgi:hypothetical protein